MAIGTTNIGVSTIRAHLEDTYSAGDNISIKDMNTKWVAIDKSNASDSRFTLTGVGTMTSDDTVTSDQSGLDSNPSSLGEWKNYNRVATITWDSEGNISDTLSVYGGYMTGGSGGCMVAVRNGCEIYCSRVGNDIVWYGGEGDHATFHTTEIQSGTITSDTEIARLAGAAADTSTTVSIATPSQGSLTNNGCFVNGSLSSSGSTSSNLVSTNTKIGYKATTMAMVECAIGGCNSKFSWPMDFVVTVAGCEPRTFRFYMGYWVHGSTTYCC